MSALGDKASGGGEVGASALARERDQLRAMLVDLVNPLSGYWNKTDRYAEPQTWAHLKRMNARLVRLLKQIPATASDQPIQPAAGPWIPGEPPDVSKDGDQILAIFPAFSEDVRAHVLEYRGDSWIDCDGDGIFAAAIKRHARINPPKQEGGEG